MASFYSRLLSREGDMLSDNVYDDTQQQPTSISFSYPNFEDESEHNIETSRDQMLFIPPTSGPMHQTTSPRYADDNNSIISQPQYHALSLSLGSPIPSLINMPLNQYTSTSFSSVLTSDMQSEVDKNVRYLSFDLDGKTQDDKVNYQVINNFQDLISSQETSFMAPSLNQAPEGTFCNSKYLKAAQDLLDQVVNVREALKLSRNGQNFNLTGQQVSTGIDIKRDGVSSTANGSCNLSPSQQQDLRHKTTKLLSMLNEVDSRYKQYLNHMKLVVSSFDMVAGNGAARPYTTLALQTISCQFRCLRDGIKRQIESNQISLGEQDGQGVLSRLRFVDQQLRQQKTMQQFGILRQPWRPQRGLPETAVSVLRAWLFEHFLHPYPKDSEKIVLARQTGLNRGQVANWFINARVRLWKPMIEEMYKEEFGEDGQDNDLKMDTTFMGSQVSLNLGLQHTETNSRLIDSEIRSKGGNESLEKLDYCYVDPLNNQHRFVNSQLLSDFVT